MRGAFNKTFDASYGMRSVVGPPGVQYASDVPCRLVPQMEISQGQDPFNLSHFWITLDAFELNVPLTSSPYSGAIFTDYFAADRVRVPAGVGPTYYVCREERVSPFGETPYWRYLIILLADTDTPPWLPPTSPPVPPPPAPAGTCSAAGIVALGADFVSAVSGTVEAWWRFTAPSAGAYHFTTVSSDVQILAYAWELPCGTGALITGWVPVGGPSPTLTLSAGETFHVQVVSADGSTQTCTMRFDVGP